MYYSDLDFRVVVHHFFRPEMFEPFTSEVNSLEFIRFGQMKVVCLNDDKTLNLIGPAIYWLRKNRRYEYSNGSEEQSGKIVEHIYCDFSGERSERILAALDELFPEGFFVPKYPDEVTEIFLDLLKLYRIDPAENMAEMGFIIEKLVNHAYKTARSTTQKDDDNYGLEKIAEKLRSEPFADYDFHALAEARGLSVDHFRRLFRQRNEMTPKEYLHYQRMIRAAEMLEFDNVRIKEIVYSCRFKSFIDFSRSFKKFSGLSPRSYRQKVRESGKKRS